MLLTPRLIPWAKRPISFDVDLIHGILYLNNVMSSWCFKDLPVWGQMTALAISDTMMTCLFVGAINTGVIEGSMGKENAWFACWTVSSNMSWDKLWGPALLLTIGCGVAGVTNLRGVVCYRRLELGAVWLGVVGTTILGDDTVCCTLWGKTGMFTLGGESLFSILIRWVAVRFLCFSRAPSNITTNFLRVRSCSLPTWTNGPAGCGCGCESA
jgi:hypothetical protein